MRIERICILGGTGFVGSHLVTHWANAGYKVRVPTRHRHRHKELLVLPEVELRQTAGFSRDALQPLFDGCDAVVNLIGILNGSEEEFRAVHAELPAAVVDACQAAGVKRYLHMSALNADAASGPSAYLRSKGAGENAAHAKGKEYGIAVTSFRPSVIFGPGDGFFNRFTGLLKLSPVMPLACPDARFAPVYVEDVAEAFAKALDNAAAFDQRLELCGPKVYTLKELVEYTAQLIGRKRWVVGLSDKLSRMQAQALELPFKVLPGDPPFSLENYNSMQVDSVCSADGFAALGITPKSVESVVPHYFRGGSRASYNKYRQAGRR